ncbi:MAG: peptidase [Thalassobius sp.]|nr:peptidase [Thalassovita sp.]
MRYPLRFLLLLFTSSITLFAQSSNAQRNKAPETSATSQNTIADKTKSMKAYEGYFNYYWDEKTGKIWLEIDKFDEEFLYVSSLSAGVGSNDLGLDRGQLGGRHIVKFERTGPKVLLIEPNYEYRAISDNEDERRSVEQAFARSVLGGFDVAAETDGKVLVDVSKFFMSDAHDVAGRLKGRKQGAYRLDENRSAFYLPMMKNFPKNTEIEATLTFTGEATGREIRSVTPTADAVTVRQHHSFVELPDDNYKPRKFDPRAGFNGISFMDYATPISEPIVKQYISRHRLEKKDPSAAMSEAVEPIIYYLDRGAPEPVRSALLEGASWWNQAFEAAGYKDAFQVRLLPEGADPMDLRYNVIQWVHRSTRGWSYGSSVRDPRTGEIIKGHVSLGSLRVRQDYLIAEGLVAAYEEGKPVSEEMLEMALARLRQLSAHEVGHTLGLMHNFAASPKDRASVMDYPHPQIDLKKDGTVTLANAYDTGIGEWDKVTIAFGYQDFPEGTDEDEALNKIVNDYIKDGFVFISDADARASGGAHPTAHLWDSGKNAADELNRLMEIRQKILDNFSMDKIRTGMPKATLEEVLAPMYMLHRYQIDAASKMLGGMNYTFAVKGDKQVVTEIVSPAEQQKALDALLNTLSPKALTLSEELIKNIPPRPAGYPRTRETFKARTGVSFDPVSAAETAANETLRFTFHPQRAARLVEFHSRDSKYPGLGEVIDEVLDYTITKAKSTSGLEKEIQMLTGKLAVRHIMNLAGDESSAAQVKAISMLKLNELKEYLDATKKDSTEEQAHYFYLSQEIAKFLRNPGKIDITAPLSPPDGSPIGMDIMCGEDYTW